MNLIQPRYRALISTFIVLVFSILTPCLFAIRKDIIDPTTGFAISITLVITTSTILLLLATGHLMAKKNCGTSQESRIQAAWRRIVSRWDYWALIFLAALIMLVLTIISEVGGYFHQDIWVLEIAAWIGGILLIWQAIFSVSFAIMKHNSQ